MCSEVLDQDVTELLNMYEKATHKNIAFNGGSQPEQQCYLLNTTFACPSSGFDICIGLNMSMDFQPTIRIPVANGTFCFTESEWKHLIINLQWFQNNYFKNNNDVSMQVSSCNGLITTHLMNDNTKVLALTNQDATLYLTESNVCDLCIIDWFFIDTKISELKILDFAKYYYNFVNVFHDYITVHHVSVDKIEALVRVFCNINSHVETYCIRECLANNKKQLIQDLQNNKKP